jgi:Aspartyl protease
MGRMTIAALLTMLAFSSAIGSALERRDEVPFKLYRGYVIVVRGSIGGLKNLNLLLDTGAVPSVLDSRIARKLRLRGQPRQIDVPNKKLATERVTVPEINVGPLGVHNLSMDVVDLSYTEDILGAKIDAMVGFDVLGQTPFTIDYESRRLIFGAIDPSFSTVPYSPNLPYALVLLHIQQETLEILVDTGASNLILFERGVRKCPSAIDVVGWETWTSLGGEMLVAKTQLLDAYLGGEAWGQRVAYISKNDALQRSGLAGLLGTVALGNRVAFDPVRKVVAWEPKEP